MAMSERAPSRIETLIERDGAHCLWCGAEPWHEDLSVEHLCPRSRGGITEEENLAVACRRCNRRRRSRSAASYAGERAVAGANPDFGLLERLLRRLAGSERRAMRAYAVRELRHLPAARARVPFPEAG